MIRERSRKLLPVLLVTGIAIWSVWPMVSCGGCVADYGRDGELITWIINTAGRNLYGLHSGISKGIFGGNIFYPYTNVLAYSDMFFLTAVWVYPLAAITYNPTLVNTAAMAAGQVTVMLVMYLWWNKITGNRWAATVATAAFGLSQIRGEYQVHLQMWSMQYMLVGTWLVTDWIEDQKDLKLYCGSVLLGLQVWESLLPVYFAGLIISAKYLVHRDRGQAINIRKTVTAILVFGVIAALPLSAYWKVSRQFGFQRSIREAAHNGMSIEELFTKFGSPGLYVLLAVGIYKIAKKNILNNDERKNVFWLSAVLVTGVVMAMGPVVKTGGETMKIAGRLPIPLPYAAAYYLIPGFDALRTPSRWMWTAGWAASGLIALGIKNYDLRFTNKNIWILIMVALAGGMRITKIRKLPDQKSMPAVYKQLESMPGEVVLEVPMGDENLETDRMVYSLYHGKTLVNGFSGIRPPDYSNLAEMVNDGLDREDIDNLKKLGVDYIVVNNSNLITLR